MLGQNLGDRCPRRLQRPVAADRPRLVFGVPPHLLHAGAFPAVGRQVGEADPDPLPIWYDDLDRGAPLHGAVVPLPRGSVQIKPGTGPPAASTPRPLRHRPRGGSSQTDARAPVRAQVEPVGNIGAKPRSSR